MNNKETGPWSIVLAGGDGNRLKELTTTESGDTIPKQFCSLNRRECLLELALQRASFLSSAERVCTIVAARHRRWWRTPLQQLPSANIFVQPMNRGTAVGAALSLLHVEKQDPEARVVLLPADHYVDDEHALAKSLDQLVCQVSEEPRTILLLGAEPESADDELGYIVPTEKGPGFHKVKEFVEKPSVEQAHSLMQAGALWNMFIVAGSVSSLLGLLEKSYNFVAPLRDALGDARPLEALTRLYSELPSIDFSRDVLSHYPEQLKVLTAPACGWTDLGTPKRVAITVREALRRSARGYTRASAVYFDLAAAIGAS
jgi:mannose-1-phosphate guanylyltransferase